MEATSICVYNKFGFCKYGVTCRKNHEEIKCENSSCDIFNCNKRHPKECRYFKEFKRCKYNEYCRYEHNVSSEVNECLKCNHDKLESKILHLEILLENTVNNFKMLKDKCFENEEKVQDLEKKLNEFVNATASMPTPSNISVGNAPY